MRIQNKECLDATNKAWEVLFLAIGKAFFEKNSLLRYGQLMVALPLK